MGVLLQAAVTVIAYVGMKVASTVSSKVESDMQCLEASGLSGMEIIFNQDASIVKNSQVMSFHKGVPYFIVNTGLGSFSLGGILFQKGSDENIVKHEWGHTVQLKTWGMAKYLYLYALPSFTCATIATLEYRGWLHTGFGEWLNRDFNYYKLPWERTAEFFGGASNYSNDENLNPSDQFKILTMSLVYYGLTMFMNL
jgi:hypothetical protein